MFVVALFKDFTSVCVCLDGKNNFTEKLRYEFHVHSSQINFAMIIESFKIF